MNDAGTDNPCWADTKRCDQPGHPAWARQPLPPEYGPNPIQIDQMQDGTSGKGTDGRCKNTARGGNRCAQRDQSDPCKPPAVKRRKNQGEQQSTGTGRQDQSKGPCDGVTGVTSAD